MKRLLKFGLAAAAVCAMSTSALAVVDFDAASPSVPSFATELDIDATTGTTLTGAGAILNSTVKVGFGATAASDRFFRYDLSNGALFQTNPTLSVMLADDGSGGAGAIAGTLASGGSGEAYAIYSFTVPSANPGAGNMSQVDVATLTMADIDVVGESNVTMTFGHYNDEPNAVNQTGALNTKTVSFVNFEAALDVDFDAVTTKKIDVTQESKVFADNTVNDLTTVIGDVNVSVDGTTLWSTGAAAALTDIVAAGTKLTLTGDFSATQDLTASVPDGTYTATNVFIDNNGGCDNQDTAFTTLAADTASYTVADNAIADAATICMIVNGKSVMAEATFSALYDVTADTNSDAADINIGTISTIEKNGSTTRLPFVLTPGGAYANYVRLVNPSSIAGKVFMTVINDAGTSVNIDVSTIAGVTGFAAGELGAGVSTNLISIDDIFAAAQAVDPTFALSTASNKLRVDVEAEFGTTGATSGIIANAFSLSTTGDTFNMIQ